MSFAAEWCTTDEVVVKECEYEGILDGADDLTWEVTSEDWNTFLAEQCTSPAV